MKNFLKRGGASFSRDENQVAEWERGGGGAGGL